MPLTRKSTLKQMKRIRKQIKAAGGDIGDKTNTKAEMKMPNSLWIDNPTDRQTDTIDDHMKLEVESFSEYRKDWAYIEPNLSKIRYINNHLNNMGGLPPNIINDIYDIIKKHQQNKDDILFKK